jgi:hypothetical protein
MSWATELEFNKDTKGGEIQCVGVVTKLTNATTQLIRFRWHLVVAESFYALELPHPDF